jgi:hypothetical protein
MLSLVRLSSGRYIDHRPLPGGGHEAFPLGGGELSDTEWQEYSELIARRWRLKLEAKRLQGEMVKAGVKLGAPLSWEWFEKNPAMKAKQSRLWYIGYALHNPALPEQSP